MQQPMPNEEITRQEAMPSLFDKLNSRTSAPLKSFIDLIHYIKYEEKTRNITENYRSMRNVDEKTAANLKVESHAICPSIQFKTKGRTLEYFEKETLILMLDYDNVIALVYNDAMEKVKACQHTMLAYRTISGRGFRVLMKYERPEGCTLTAMWG